MILKIYKQNYTFKAYRKVWIFKVPYKIYRVKISNNSYKIAYTQETGIDEDVLINAIKDYEVEKAKARAVDRKLIVAYNDIDGEKLFINVDDMVLESNHYVTKKAYHTLYEYENTVLKRDKEKPILHSTVEI